MALSCCPKPADTGYANHKKFLNPPSYLRAGDTPGLQECWQGTSIPLPPAPMLGKKLGRQC